MSNIITYSKDNRYIQAIQQLFDYVYYLGNTIEVVENSSLVKRWKLKRKTINEFLVGIDKFVESVLDKNYEEISTFENLWEYIQFVRFAEKMLLYDNDPDRELYVDSDLDSNIKRNMVISKQGYTIFILLEHKSLEDTNNVIHIKTIRVIHETGRKLQNNFVIVNDNPKFNDDSDIYLLYEFGILLKEAILETLIQITNNLKQQFMKILERAGWNVEDYL